MKFVTLLLAFYEIANGTLYYANAGHVFPIMLGRNGAVEVQNPPDPALGVIEDMAFVDHQLSLGPGETLILASDGLTDFQDGELNSFGIERVLAAAGSATGGSARAVVEQIIAAGVAFADGAPQFDDVTVLAVRRLA